MIHFRNVVAVAAAGLALLPAGAAAQADPAGACRASGARADVKQPVQAVAEPVRANAATVPCTPQSAETLTPTTVGPVKAAALGAFTATDGKGATSALASAADADLTLGDLKLEVDALQASAQAACDGTLGGASRVAGLTINGNAVALPPGDEPFELPLGELGTVYLNQEVREGGRITRRAVHVTTPLADVTLGEAIAGPGSCPSGGGGTGATPPNPCPAGATYDPSRNVCVIREGGTGGGDGGSGGGDGGSGGGGGTSGGSGETQGVVVVGRPFEGPSGGTVISLEEARRRFKSVCLAGGRGPAYVIVGTNGSDRITGTNGRDRILLLGGRDRSEGGRGDDCIDGGSGVDTMSGALGQDYLIGRTGGDHLVGGSHADRLSGGSGNDTVNTGYGNDRVNAGSGRDYINAAVAGKAAARLTCGTGPDKLRINRNERRRHRGCERVYVIR